MTDTFGVGGAAGSPLGNPATTVDAVLIAAMEEEITPLERRAEHLAHRRNVGAARAVIATIADRRLLLVRSGIGAVNAATAAAIAIHAVRTPLVVSVGSAGGLGPDVRIGDVVVGNDHAFAMADATAFGYVRGQIPGMPASYPGAPALVERARNRAGVLVGQMISGDAFIDARTVDHYRAAFPEALTADMETAAIAQVCHFFDVPYLAVRGVSDLCGPEAGADFRLAVDDVAALAADVVLELVDVPAALTGS